VQIDPDAKSPLIDDEESSEPRAEEPNHSVVGICERDGAVRLSSLARIKSDAGREESAFAERADAVDPSSFAGIDLGQFCDTLPVRTPGNRLAAPDLDVDVADPKAHARLRDAQLARYSGERPPLLAQFTRAGLFFDLASVPHSPIVKTGCDS
jgi:hypothetical protein